METVWRVQDKYGKGPYRRFSTNEIVMLGDPQYEGQRLRWQWSYEEDMRREHNDSRHPSPYDDGISGMSSAHICGFRTKGQALQWFYPWMKKLMECGFTLEQVGAKSVKYGSYQLVFIRDPPLPHGELWPASSL